MALREPQTAEQLVEVPTVVSWSSLQQLSAEHIVGTPVPRGSGGQRLQGSLPVHRVQQRSPLSSSLTFILVFKEYAQARVQQRFLEVRRSGPPRSSLTFQFLVVEVPAVFLVLSQNREPQLCMLFRNAFRSSCRSPETEISSSFWN